MGHRKKHAPKRGSLAFSPRKRAASLVPSISEWPNVQSGDPRVLGFAGFKAGMTGIVYVESDENSINYGSEVHSAVTVLETPPILAAGLVAYAPSQKTNSLQVMKTALADELPEDVAERLGGGGPPGNVDEIEERIDDVALVRILVAARPRMVSTPQKTADVFEVQVGGGAGVAERFEYAKSLLGRTIPVHDVHSGGEVIDVVAVTKGKGFQGPVKRFGIKTLPPKSRKAKRKPAALGPWAPEAMMYSVPGAGQMGGHTRTQMGVKIFKLGEAGEGLKKHFHKYGPVRNDYLILKGSVPGPAKRLVRTRLTIRPPTHEAPAPEVLYVKAGE